ncbi:lipid A export permease/ATP-binding protein MsbA [Gilliamella sp. B14384H2]|uniref:lipid A export permease/ATP-binding protein MsbA n=1 Tax=unclassified Gilliamella TaxID=2685620 RepID=UPI0018DC1E99|nr:MULTISPECIES: lipid A export permease/ATP-binding protein MsbA [unclassified Gilliamella]MBI0037003.1 lipid A export permease/ATP-binding protein MsbA [Gilliamella sp. B14384G10]MBI0039343.1 lipid A export permease/ATP-binding protein MsbA [Gilliamella sp. B14384G7]MBI0050998.1 lipid A export permease/ATP-binding protein MsbA [Gilliamella sp. B14384G13]MBI0053290.1 lipid A export permease/ATP-binding protein MsbA [Gilliamella sp. B14384H2]
MPQKLNSITSLKKLWPFIKPYKRALIVAVFGLLLNAATDATLISLTKPLLDHGLMDKNYSLLIIIAIAIIVLILLRGLSNYISTYCLSWLSGKVVTKFRQMIFNHLVKSPISFHDKQSIGDLVSVITFNTQMLSKASSDALIILIREITYAVGLCLVMLYGSWKLASVLIILVPLIIFAAQFIARKFRETIASMQAGMGQITIASDEMLKGHKEVLIFNAKEYEKRNFDRITDNFRRSMLKIEIVSRLSTPIIQLIATAGLGFILYLVASQNLDITPGSFTVVFSAMVAVMRPLRELTSLHVELQKGTIACESLFALLDSPLEDDNGTILADRVKGNIEFKNVTYTYPTRNAPVLNDFCLKIEAGQMIALVGRSGAGKSTIASLLPRFYDVSEGEILLDSINIKEYTLKSLRKQIGYVSQNVHLFNGSIAENIAYGEQGYHSEEDIIRAAKQANAIEFINKLEHGINTQIGDNGILLSGGQRQRIAIARVLLRDNPILIFDEATSALDNESERLVQEAIEILQKDRTSIIIAHRLSTIEKADRILVIDDGKVIEDGDHQSLINLNGIYAQMYEMQFNTQNKQSK